MKMLLATTAGLALAASTAMAANWDMPTAYPASSYHTETAVAFGECVGTGTGGELTITVHPNGSLFKGNEIKRAVQTGQAPIGERLLSAHQNENPIFGIDSIPFLATTFDQAAALWDAAKPAYEELLDEQNLVLLYSVVWPPQGLYFNQPVETAADMEGLKFRSYNPTTAHIAELTGMLPVQIEQAEISQAFATGVADAMISSGATGYNMKVWENLTHFYTVDAWMPRNYIFANKDMWSDLDEATQSVVRGCASLAAFAGHARAVQFTDFTLKGLADHGMTVAAPSDELNAKLQEVGETLVENWKQSAGEEGQAIIDSYSSTQ